MRVVLFLLAALLPLSSVAQSVDNRNPVIANRRVNAILADGDQLCVEGPCDLRAGTTVGGSPIGGGGGAPTTADYLVGTANGSLSAEIVVGTTPGGELGGTWASPTIDSGVVDFSELSGSATDAQVPDTVTINGGAITPVQSTAPVPTAEGRIEWETDDDHLIVGDGVAQVEFVPAEDVSGDATMTDAGVVAVADDSHNHGASTISALDAGDTTTGTFADARIDGSLEADEVNPTLGTQTQGNYVDNVTGDAEIVVTHTPAEGSEPALSIAASIARDAEVAAAYQPLDSDLTSIAGVATTAFGRGLLAETSDSTLRSTLALVPGVNVQIFDTDLDDLADGSLTGSKVGTGIAAGNITTGTVPDAQVDGAAESDEITGLSDAQISDTLTASTSTTAAANDNDTSIATTAFVQQEIDDGDLLTDNCVLENDSTPIPDSCVGDGTDGGGGGGSPGTPTGSVQYNSASAFAGAANVNIDANGDLNIDERASVAATPTASMTLFVRERAGKRFLNVIGPSGLDTPLQNALFANSVAIWLPNTGTTPEEIGMDAAVTATVSHPAIATTDLWSSIKRFRMATSTTAGNSSGVRSNADLVWRGNAAGRGGWFWSSRCTSNVTVAQGRAFVGLADQTAVIGNVNPSTLLDTAYFGFDSAQTTWRFCTNDNAGAATCVDLGANFPTNLSSDGFEMRMFAAPNSASIGYWAERLGTGATASGTVTTDLPRNTVLLSAQLWNNNGTTAAANNLECNRVYIESDY